jgi:hypothetical protein
VSGFRAQGPGVSRRQQSGIRARLVTVPAGAMRAAGAASAGHGQRRRGLGAVAAADHARAREELLEIRSLTRGALRRPFGRDERFELALAVAAPVLEYWHGPILLVCVNSQLPIPNSQAESLWELGVGGWELTPLKSDDDHPTRCRGVRAAGVGRRRPGRYALGNRTLNRAGGCSSRTGPGHRAGRVDGSSRRSRFAPVVAEHRASTRRPVDRGQRGEGASQGGLLRRGRWRLVEDHGRRRINDAYTNCNRGISEYSYCRYGCTGTRDSAADCSRNDLQRLLG